MSDKLEKINMIEQSFSHTSNCLLRIATLLEKLGDKKRSEVIYDLMEKTDTAWIDWRSIVGEALSGKI